MRGVGPPQQVRQLRLFGGGEVTELPAVHRADLGREFVQQPLSRRRERDLDHAAVLRPAFADDQPPLFEPVEHAGDVGGTGDQPASQFERRHGVGSGAPQQPQGVVLLGRKFVAPEQRVLGLLEAVVGPPQVEEDLLLAGVEAAGPAA